MAGQSITPSDEKSWHCTPTAYGWMTRGVTAEPRRTALRMRWLGALLKLRCHGLLFERGVFGVVGFTGGVHAR